MRTTRGIRSRAWACAFVIVLAGGGCQPASRPAPEQGAGVTPAPTDGTNAAPIDTSTQAQESDDPSSIVQAYYRAINERRYDEAYRLWASGGEASGKSLAQFRAGFVKTASVEVSLDPPGPIEGAAGSRYVEIPVRIHAVTTDGAPQAYVGTYTLRRSVVDGATADQRAWRIYSAKIHPARP